MSLNPRQKRFAENYHRHGNGTRAYGEAGDVEKTETGTWPAWCAVEAHRYLRNPKVLEEIARLRGESASLAAMSREETIDFLVQAITTPVGEIGPDSPLCEEYTFHRLPGKEGEVPIEVVKIKCVSKLGAIKELVRMTGMAAPQKVEVSADAAVVNMLAGIMGAKKE